VVVVAGRFAWKVSARKAPLGEAARRLCRVTARVTAWLGRMGGLPSAGAVVPQLVGAVLGGDAAASVWSAASTEWMFCRAELMVRDPGRTTL
jgi:hypothetical protein